MFDRFIRLAEARNALAKGHFEQALQLCADPLVRDQRRTRELRRRALEGLVARARRRQSEGGLAAALSDVSRVLGTAPEFDGAATLDRELKAAVDSESTAAREAAAMIVEARRAAAEGRLAEAEQQCRAAAELHALPAEQAAVEALVVARRRAAEALLRQARVALSGEPERARDLLAEARGQDQACADAGGVAQEVAAALAKAILPQLELLCEQGEADRALDSLRRHRLGLPELDGVPGVQRLLDQATGSWSQAMKKWLDSGEFERAADVYAEMDARLLQEPGAAELVQAMDALQRGIELRGRGDCVGAADEWDAAAQRVASRTLRKAAAELRATGRRWEQAIAKAREQASTGDLLAARGLLLPILETCPMHEAARCEMALLDQGDQDREARLAQARSLAADGRLAEASALAVSLVGAGPQGEKARILLAELRARTDLVTRGLDQVRRALHGRDSVSVEGLRHSRSRLEQLLTVQADNDEASALLAAVDAEIEGIQLLQRASEALARGEPKVVGESLGELPSVRGRLLRANRLDARCLELADRVAECAEEALRAGRVTDAEVWTGILSSLGAHQDRVSIRANELGAELAARRERADAAVRRGHEALDQRDLEAAERSLDDARQVAVDHAGVRRLEHGLVMLRAQEDEIGEVERLTAGQDLDAAQRKLSRMPPTPALLRTRIFDLKQNLARAQGLEQGFLLRVDEGGEYLVLRRDTCTIGNVREGHADLAILASIAGRHARIVRSLSFHGGMQDKVVADRGVVSVRGRAVSEHRLEDGDRIKLGKVLEVVYRVPSKRSITAQLSLPGGFQVAGTDKVLLMKDRGRDGRILIGPTADVHVRTPHAQPEVELFATKDGQIRVRFDGSGEINGQPFAKEHPVEAGALVRCGDVVFVLQPWHRG